MASPTFRSHAGVVAVLVVWTSVTTWQSIGRVEARAGAGEPHAPALLSETGLFAHGSTTEIDGRNRTFSPQYPLWTDGAAKRRWVYLPPGAQIDGRDEASWVLPVGTRFWKEFSFGGRKVETRMSWRATPDRWVFASYVWNDDGTGATLASADGVVGVAEVAPGKRHSVPSVSDCTACHGAAKTTPLGFNALQLSSDRDPNAIHGEAFDADMVTTTSLVLDGLLASARPDLARRAPRISTSRPETRTVLGYLAANCGSCHNGNGEIAALGPVLRLSELLADGDAVAARLVNQRTSWQVPGAAPGTSVVIDPAVPELSAMLVRMRSRRPSSQMPPLGTVVRDEAAVRAIESWISGLGH